VCVCVCVKSINIYDIIMALLWRYDGMVKTIDKNNYEHSLILNLGTYSFIIVTFSKIL